MVQNDVEAEHLEANRVLLVVWLGRPVGVLERGMHRDDGLRQAILDVGPQFVHIYTRLVLSDVLPNSCHRPFVAAGVVVHVLIEDEVV